MCVRYVLGLTMIGELCIYRVCGDMFQVSDNFVPPLLDAVLLDYQKNVPHAREPEVLSTMASIVNKLEGHITSSIPQIFDAVFECTLDMINKVGQQSLALHSALHSSCHKVLTS